MDKIPFYHLTRLSAVCGDCSCLNVIIIASTIIGFNQHGVEIPIPKIKLTFTSIYNKAVVKHLVTLTNTFCCKRRVNIV